jgi:lipopolysaccharide export system permease protein
MKLYTKYIGAYFGKIFLLFACALTFVAVLLQVTLFLNTSANSLDIGAAYILKFMLLQVPLLLVYTLPMSLVCAVIYTTHTLYSDNELLILELSGVNKRKIALPIIVISLIVMIFAQIMCAFINPLTKKYVLLQREMVQRGLISSMLKEKTFTKISSKLMLYTEQRVGPKELKGIIIYDKTDPKGTATVLAESGAIVDKDTGIAFKLYNGSRQVLAEGTFQTLYFRSWLFDIAEYSKKFLWNFSGTLDTQSIYKLIKMRLKNNATRAAKVRLDQEIHQRFSWPLLNLVLPILFLFSTLGIENNRDKTNKNLGVSVSLAIATTFLYFFLLNRVVAWNGFVPLLYLNPLAFCALGLFLLKKSDGNKMSAL